MATELDKISFELELASEMDDDEIETFDDDTDDDLDDFYEDFIDDLEDDVDAEIFDDPVLMVKWLEQRQKQLDGEGDGTKNSRSKRTHEDLNLGGQVHSTTGYTELECFEAERRERERLEAERREREHRQTEERKAWHRKNNRCQYCGGEFKGFLGFFAVKCKNCGKPKDY